MSVRQPKSPRQQKYPLAVQIIATLSGEAGSNLFTEIMPRAEAKVPALVRAGLEIDAVAPAASALVRECYPDATDLELVRELAGDQNLPPKTRDALDSVQWMHAEAGFGLGLALGMRLGGTR